MGLSLLRAGTQLQPGSVTAALLAAGAAAANLGFTPLNPANNLSELAASAIAARANLGIGNAALSMGGFTITNLGAPVNTTDAANKTYVDSAINGLTVHPDVRVVAVANVALTGLQTIDVVTLVAGDRVLLTAQATAAQNGPWLAAAGSWTRPADWAAASSQKEGAYIMSYPDGSNYGNTKWRCTTTGAITVDTTSTSWSQDLSGSVYTNGNGLTLSGNSFAVNADPNRMLQAVAAGVGIKDGAAGQVLMANAAGNASYQTMSGDATISSTGVVTANTTAGSGLMRYTSQVTGETPAGAINSANTAYTLAHAPQNGSLKLYINGQRLAPGAGNDYTIAGASITMLFAPQPNDVLLADYQM